MAVSGPTRRRDVVGTSLVTILRPGRLECGNTQTQIQITHLAVNCIVAKVIGIGFRNKHYKVALFIVQNDSVILMRTSRGSSC